MCIINWLEKWFLSNCDGGWEHYHECVSITTLDNPGWSVKINTSETAYEGIQFDDIRIHRSDNDWIDCQKEQQIIKCFGGPGNLQEILKIVKKWVEDNEIT